MRTFILKSLFFFATTTITVSCDFVQDANPPLETVSGGSGINGIDISDSITIPNSSVRKVMIEDYTGHKCGNCPAAAVELSNIETSNPGKIVPIAIHAGFFAKTNLQYPTDFQTTTGDTYDIKFGNSAAGNPNGLINRTDYGNSNFIKQYSSWSSATASQLATTPKFQISIKYKYNTGSLKLNADVTVKSLVNNTGIYKVVILLTEDSIIAEQLDYSKPVGSQFIANYEFNHVLRATINSAWGDNIFTSGAPLNTTETVSKTNFQLSSTFKIPKCHLVAYIYDADASSPTYYEVLQSEKLKMK